MYRMQDVNFLQHLLKKMRRQTKPPIKRRKKANDKHLYEDHSRATGNAMGKRKLIARKAGVIYPNGTGLPERSEKGQQWDYDYEDESRMNTPNSFETDEIGYYFRKYIGVYPNQGDDDRVSGEILYPMPTVCQVGTLSCLCFFWLLSGDYLLRFKLFELLFSCLFLRRRSSFRTRCLQLL